MSDPAPDPRDLALGAAVAGARVAARAARLAFVPVRIASRVPVVGLPIRRVAGGLASEGRAARVRGREELESATAAIVAAPEVERVVDGALESPLTDAVARSLAEHRVVERVAAQVLADAELERAVRAGLEHDAAERLAVDVLESKLAADLTDRLLASPELKRVIEEVASSPAIRSALGNQTEALAEEVGASVRHGGARLDARAEGAARRLFRRRPASEATASYGGVATRAAALAVDIAISHGIVLLLTALAGLAASLVGDLRPEWLVAFLVAFGWTLVTGGYFVLFWSTAGQTPGMRLLRLRVRGPGGEPPGVGRSLVRFVGLVLAIVPLFAGFLPVLFDDRRRGLPDLLAGTDVVSTDEAYERAAVSAATSAAGPSTASATHA